MMAGYSYRGAGASFLVLSLLLLIASLVQVSEGKASDIAVYWGRHRNEGTLADTCATGNYDYVMLASLTNFGGGRTGSLDFDGHDTCPCTVSGFCRELRSNVSYCQRTGVKVLLSIGGDPERGNYSVGSAEEAKQFASHLWITYLSGSIWGGVVLDGIDFDIRTGGDQHWGELAERLMALIEVSRRKVYLSAAPGCPHPDPHLSKAINTGVFDFVWIKFYNEKSCEYTHRNATNLIKAWKKWTSVPVKQIFLGLPAARQAGSGYIPPCPDLIDWVLPAINDTTKYGGVMLWNRFYDQGYSDAIKCGVCRNLPKLLSSA